MTKYGYIGLGQMGSAMTEHLLSTGATVTVYDLDTSAIDRAVAGGATAAVSAASVAAEVDVLSICVPAAHHIDAVLNGPDGVRSAGNTHCSVLIHSTVAPETMQKAQADAAEWGAQCFDACVAGGAEAARTGGLAIFAGGTDAMSPEVRSLLDIYGSKVIEAGPVGSGAAIKIGFNVMTYAQQAAARASFALVSGAGASTDALVDAWRHIGQLGTLTEQFLGLLAIPAEHIKGDFRAALETTVSIGEKDLELAHALPGNDANMAGFIAALKHAMPSVIGVTTTGEQ